MINLIYNASFLVSKIVQVLIFSTFIAVVFVTFLVSVPVLFALEVYCLLIVITVLTVFSGSEEARLTIGERFLSIAGIFLIYDAVSALISTFKSSDSKVKYKYKIYLGHFRAKTRRTPNSGSSYLESKARPKASTRFAISYTLVAPLIAAAVLSMPALYFLSDSIYNFWFVFTATLLFAPVFYFFVNSRLASSLRLHAVLKIVMPKGVLFSRTQCQLHSPPQSRTFHQSAATQKPIRAE